MDEKGRAVLFGNNRESPAGIQPHVIPHQAVKSVRPYQNNNDGWQQQKPQEFFISQPSVVPGETHAQRLQGYGRIAVGKILNVRPEQLGRKISSGHFKRVAARPDGYDQHAHNKTYGTL